MTGERIDDDMVEALLQPVDRSASRVPGQQVGGVRRMRPGGDHAKAVVRGRANDPVEIVAAGEEVADPGAVVLEAEILMDRRRAKVRVDQHDLALARGRATAPAQAR